jgi:hypothetical protein
MELLPPKFYFIYKYKKIYSALGPQYKRKRKEDGILIKEKYHNQACISHFLWNVLCEQDWWSAISSEYS